MVLDALTVDAPSYTELISYMAHRGIRPRGEMAYSGALDRVFEKYGLNCRIEHVELTQLARFFRGGALCIIEITQHVLVLIDINLTSRRVTLCDPAIGNIEEVDLTDARLQKYLRICYVVWR